jgi:hypothetical protein
MRQIEFNKYDLFISYGGIDPGFVGALGWIDPFATPAERAHRAYTAATLMEGAASLDDEDGMADQRKEAEHQLLATRASSVADMRLKLDVFCNSYGEDLISYAHNEGRLQTDDAIIKDLFASLWLDIMALTEPDTWSRARISRRKPRGCNGCSI